MLLFKEKSFKMKKIILLLSFLCFTLFANEKYLILADGNSWVAHTPKNFIENHDKISKLPFSGFVVVGDTFTNKCMKKGSILKYENVWNELKGLKKLYKQKHNFLQINIEFAADFWNDNAWKTVSDNFAIVAKAAKELDFEGIVFDDEPYSVSAQKMTNFKFPTRDEINKKPKKYTSWEKQGSQQAWVDKNAYRNLNYTFLQHTQKVQSRFKNIMSAMVKKYPALTVLVYLGPSLSHPNSNKDYPIVINLGLARENELHGAIFTGLKQGLGTLSSLHDMGESYKYRKNKHFGYAYQWRKHNIAKDKYNDSLNPNFQWVVPKNERKTWSEEIQIGFMVFNKGQKSTYEEYDTINTSGINDIKSTLQKALKYSDKYVIYYCHDQEWLLPQKNPPTKQWIKMMEDVHDKH